MRIERAAITAQHEASVECRYGARVSVAVKVLLVLQRETERFADVVQWRLVPKEPRVGISDRLEVMEAPRCNNNHNHVNNIQVSTTLPSYYYYMHDRDVNIHRHAHILLTELIDDSAGLVDDQGRA